MKKLTVNSATAKKVATSKVSTSKKATPAKELSFGEKMKIAKEAKRLEREAEAAAAANAKKKPAKKVVAKPEPAKPAKKVAVAETAKPKTKKAKVVERTLADFKNDLKQTGQDLNLKLVGFEDSEVRYNKATEEVIFATYLQNPLPEAAPVLFAYELQSDNTFVFEFPANPFKTTAKAIAYLNAQLNVLQNIEAKYAGEYPLNFNISETEAIKIADFETVKKRLTSEYNALVKALFAAKS